MIRGHTSPDLGSKLTRNGLINMPPILLQNLKDYLQILQNKEEQILVWSGKTESVLDYIETMCGIFTDTGFDILFKEGRAEQFFGPELTEILSRIDKVTEAIDPYDDPVAIANLPEMEEVRQLAKEALNSPLFIQGNTEI